VVRTSLTSSAEPGHNAFAHLTRSYNKVVSERVKPDRSSPAEVSQLQLLNRLIEDLRSLRGAKGLRQVNFVCVIPKADLFVKDPSKGGDENQYFFTDFYNYLKSRRVMTRSGHFRGDGSEEDFSGYYTLGGAGSAGADPLTPMAAQRRLVRELSEQALACLRKIGSALGSDDDDELWPRKASLVSFIEIQLVQMLYHVFGEANVFFLPVSAQGQDQFFAGPAGATADRRLGHPPNQKLSEYVFMLPVILAVSQAHAGQA
jgi:hypothetical protein